MDLGLSGKIALVSGSTRGIGFATAKAFLDEGASVVITGRDESSLRNACAELESRFGQARILSLCKDMRSEAAVAEAVSSAVSMFGDIDVFVGVVGSGTASTGWDITPDEWSSVLQTNLLSSAILATAAMKHFLSRRPGTVVLISSIAGCEAIGAPIPYGAAKAALQSTVKSLSRLAGPLGVRINAVSPGNVWFPGGTWEAKLNHGKEFFENYIRTEVPLQRFGSPTEIADAVLFLSSERASFITGACLVVDGGQTHSFM